MFLFLNKGKIPQFKKESGCQKHYIHENSVMNELAAFCFPLNRNPQAESRYSWIPFTNSC